MSKKPKPSPVTITGPCRVLWRGRSDWHVLSPSCSVAVYQPEHVIAVAWDERQGEGAPEWLRLLGSFTRPEKEHKSACLLDDGHRLSVSWGEHDIVHVRSEAIVYTAA